MYTKPADLDLRNTFILDRRWFTDKSTIGEFIMDGLVFCYTLEDTCRAKGIKIYGATAIPAGRYELKITMSQRFKYDTPILLSVPNFEGVRIHKGNTDEDTEGCILVGMRHGEDVLYDSKRAFDLLLPEMRKRIEDGPLYLMIYGGS